MKTKRCIVCFEKWEGRGNVCDNCFGKAARERERLDNRERDAEIIRISRMVSDINTKRRRRME
jgi:hypothetical protein